DAVADALRRHRIEIDPDEFLGVLHDVVGSPAATLTAGEQQFLTRPGVAPENYDAENLQRARRRLALLGEPRETHAQEGLTTREVAQLLGVATSNVRRLLGQRSVYASGRAARGEHVFPAWQFVGGTVLPHLAAPLSALPEDMHPL